LHTRRVSPSATGQAKKTSATTGPRTNSGIPSWTPNAGKASTRTGRKPSPRPSTGSTPTANSTAPSSSQLRTGRRLRPVRCSIQVVVPHELPARLGDRTGQRRVHRERHRQIVHGQVILHRERNRQDQLTGIRRCDDTTDDDPRRRTAEQFHETVP